ncbi:STM4015 family protein [Streptomyces sp. SYP-A7185]|uniref:STM4015 family protein n=1 Tax=Streptomyces sp. SYP-A7185 TaxID=3040076 RepID=UPI0038F796CC
MGYRTAHLDWFHGLPVFAFPCEGDGPREALPSPESVAWRFGRTDGDGDITFEQQWQRFLDSVPLHKVRAMVIGRWWQEYEDVGIDAVIESLCAARDRLTGLRALFLADVLSEEFEISWIRLGDLTPLLKAFPLLEKLGVRGGEGLVLEPVHHMALRELRFESGGLPAAPVRALGACEFPALDHLELWLGTSWYGGDTAIEDIAPLLAPGVRMPSLRHLGLQNSDIQDEIAAAVAGASVVPQLDSLALSMGALSDDGAAALLGGQPLTHLRTLDLHHHFLSAPMTQRVRFALEPHGVRVDLRRGRAAAERSEARYVAVGE